MMRGIHRPLLRRALLAFAITCLTVLGCGSDEKGAGPSVERERRTESLSAGQIAGVVAVINQSEMTQAQAARPRLQDDDVRAFADKLMTDHRDADTELATLQEKVDADTQSSNMQREIALLGQNMARHVDRESQELVDPTFLEVQVFMHRKAIMTVEQQLLPQATQPELRAYLENFLGKLRAHLERATQLRKRFPDVDFPR